MKNKKILIISFLMVLIIGLTGFTTLYSNPLIVSMISAEKTGKSRKVYVERGYWIKEYEIKVEWYSDFVERLDLYRSSSPGAYPNGTCVALDVYPYHIEVVGYDPEWGLIYYCAYRNYNWVVAGTWYYMAEYAVDEVNETVP